MSMYKLPQGLSNYVRAVSCGYVECCRIILFLTKKKIEKVKFLNEKCSVEIMAKIIVKRMKT